MLSVLKVQEISQNPFACLSTLFRVELRSVEIVFLNSRAERVDVLCLCNRTFIDRYIEAMDEIDELFLVETIEQVSPCSGQCIPSHVRYLVLVLLGVKTLHIGLEDAQTVYISCIPRQMPNTGCFKSLISWSSPVRRR